MKGFEKPRPLGGELYYGYKNHINVDKKHKLIRQYAVTDAAVHDSQVLEDVLLPAEAGRDIWADSAYRSKEIETQLKAKRLRSKIHDKGYRNKALTAQQETRNRARSRTRARVEHVFGHQVTARGGQTHSHNWPHAGSGQDRAEEFDVQLPALFGSHAASEDARRVRELEGGEPRPQNAPQMPACPSANPIAKTYRPATETISVRIRGF